MSLLPNAREPQNLPADVLLEIFHAYRTSCLEDIDEGADPCKPYEWIWASHACRHWRSVAIESPTLWALVVVTHAIECIKTMIKRSRNAPLIVRAHPAKLKRVFDQDALSAVFEVLHRVRDIDFCAESQSLTKLGHLPSSKSAEVLENFYVYNQSRWSCGMGSPLAFITDAPNLRSLFLSGLNLNQSSRMIVPSLVRLTWEASNPADPQQLLVALAPLKQLRHLVLKRAFDETTVSHLPTDPFTHEFPHLKEFTLEGGTIGCTWFLDHIQLPADTRIAVRSSEQWDSELSLVHVLRLITSVASKCLGSEEKDDVASPSPFACEFLRGERRHQMEVRMWLPKLGVEDFLSEDRPKPSFTLAVPLIDNNRYDAANQLIPKVIESFKLSDVQALHIQRFETLKRWDAIAGLFQRAFSHAAHLQTLVTTNWKLETLPKILSSETGSSTFAVLDRLTLNNTWWPAEDKQASDLSSILKTYRGKGTGAIEVVVKDSYSVREEDIARSRDVVNSVNWDNVSAPVPDEDAEYDFSDDES